MEQSFKNNPDSNITIIVAGIQILPDRWFLTEAFNWKNKKVIIDLIKKYEKSGVVLLSGDVHFS